MKEIKRCPFCNGKARVSVRQNLFIGWVGEAGNKKIDYAAQVICNKCHARGGVTKAILVSDSDLQDNIAWLKDLAIDMWNRREEDG